MGGGATNNKSIAALLHKIALNPDCFFTKTASFREDGNDNVNGLFCLDKPVKSSCPQITQIYAD
jgi:hypothetical protein